MKCAGCRNEFTPQKSYYRLCGECFKTACKCLLCGKIVMPKDGSYSCCGVTESIARAGQRSRLAGMSFEDMVFTLQNNMMPDEAFRFHFGEEAYEDLISRG